MLQLKVHFLVLFVTFNTAKGHSCPDTSSEDISNLDFADVAERKWDFIGISKSSKDPPFQFPEHHLIQAQMKLSSVKLQSIFIHRLSFKFFCATEKFTMTDVSMLFDTQTKQKSIICRYCSGRNILSWPLIRMRVDYVRNLLMFYACSTETASEQVIVFGSDWNLSEDHKKNLIKIAAKRFLNDIDSSLVLDFSLKFRDDMREANGCLNFTNFCTRHEDYESNDFRQISRSQPVDASYREQKNPFYSIIIGSIGLAAIVIIIIVVQLVKFIKKQIHTKRNTRNVIMVRPANQIIFERHVLRSYSENAPA